MTIRQELDGHALLNLPAYFDDIGDQNNLLKMLLDAEYLIRKTLAYGTAAVLQDLSLPLVRENHGVQTMRELFDKYAHIFEICDGSLDLANSLIVRLQSEPQLEYIAKKYIERSREPLLLPVTRLPDIASRHELRTIRYFLGATSLVFSEAGDLIYAGDKHSYLRAWEVDSGLQRFTSTEHTGDISKLALVPNKNKLLSASKDTTIILWDLEQGVPERVFRGHSDDILDISVSPSCQWVASCSSDHSLKLWSLESGELIESIEFSSVPQCCTFLAHDEQLAVGFSNGDVHIIANMEIGTAQVAQAASNKIQTICYDSSRGHIITGGKDQRIVLWSAKDLTKIAELAEHKDEVLNLVIDADGQFLLSSGEDDLVLIWDLQRRELYAGLHGHTAAFKGGIPGLALSPDGQLLASGSYNEDIKLWHFPRQPDLEFANPEYGYHCEFNRSTNILSTANGTITFWDCDSWEKLVQVRSERYENSVSALAPNGNALWIGTVDGELIRLSFPDLQLELSVSGHSDRINQIATSSHYIATASDDSLIKLWDQSSLELVSEFEGHPSYAFSCDISPDEKMVASAGLESALFIWDITSARQITRLQGHPTDVAKCRFSPSGNYLLSASHDGTAKLWNTRNWSVEKSFEGHINWVNDAVFNPKGDLVATVSLDESIRIWDVASGDTISILRVDGALEGIDWHADGTHLVAAGHKGVFIFEFVLPGASPNRA